MQTQHILIKPVISEKSLKDAAIGKYTFLVNNRANKTEIKKAIEEVFSVNIVKILTNTTKGSTTKNTKVGRKVNVFANKKARVTLKNGQKIDIFEEHLEDGSTKDKKAKKETKKTGEKEEVK